MSEVKTCTLTKCHLEAYFQDQLIVLSKTDFFDQKIADRQGGDKSVSSVSTSISAIPIAYPDIGLSLRRKCVYNTMQNKYYWPPMTKDWYMTLRDCKECVRDTPSKKRRRTLKLLLAKGPLEFVRMDILGQFLKSSNGNTFRLIVMNWCSKYIIAVRKSRMIASHYAWVLMDHSVALY